MPIDLTDRLLQPDIDQGELECFLSTLGDSTQTARHRITYGGWVEATFAAKGINKGKIQRLEWIHGDSAGMADWIVRRADEALRQDTGTGVDYAYVFARRPFEGFVRIGNDFQLVPPPDDAPRPSFDAAAHPGLLEFSFRRSANEYVHHYRSECRKRDLILFLQVVLGPTFTGPPSYNRHEWVLIQSSAGDYNSDYCQVGYWPKSQWITRDAAGFSQGPWPAIARLSARSFYTRLGVGAEPFQVPATLELSCQAFALLSEENRTRFLRAAHWYKASNEVLQSSMSLAYAVLVFALEALMPQARSGPKCATCGLESRESISARFRTFLDRYCVGIPRKQIGRFQNLRSRVVHGHTLMLRDAETIGFRASPVEDEDYRELYGLQSVCQVAMINWLHDASGATAKSER